MLVSSALAALLVHQLANVSQDHPPGGPRADDAPPEVMAAMREGGQERVALCAMKPGPSPEMAELAATPRNASKGKKLAVATVLTDEDGLEGFVQGAIALGASLLEHLTLPADKLLLVRDNVTLPRGAARRLGAVGWRLGKIPTILPPHPPIFGHFAHQFSKLALWNLTKYSRILYMDADTFALGNLDPAFNVVLEQGQYLAAVRDFLNGHVLSHSDFNMGVAVLRPNKTECARLLDLLLQDKVPYRYNWAEQGFLRAVYHRSHAELPLEFNGNVACEHQRPDLWNVSLPDMRVVHFTLCKPWKCRSRESRFCGQYDNWKHFLDRGELLAKPKVRKPRPKA